MTPASLGYLLSVFNIFEKLYPQNVIFFEPCYIPQLGVPLHKYLCGTPYYCAPRVCVLNVAGGLVQLAGWQLELHTKQQTKVVEET